MLFMLCITYWKVFHLFCFFFFKLHFGHISRRDVKNKFYVLPWKKNNNKIWLIAEYHKISHPTAILDEAQGHQGNLLSAALGGSRWYVFAQFWEGGERLLQSAKHYKNKIQPSKQCSRPGLLLAFDKLREMRLQSSMGNLLPFMLMKYCTFVSWD